MRGLCLYKGWGDMEKETLHTGLGSFIWGDGVPQQEEGWAKEGKGKDECPRAAGI